MNAPDKKNATLLWIASAVIYVGTVLCVAFHPAGREGDLVNFRANTSHAAAAAVSMILTVALFLLASRASSFKGTTRIGCGTSIAGFVLVLIAAFTVVPESWSQQELQHIVGNLLWVTAMPGVAIFVIGLRIR